MDQEKQLIAVKNLIDTGNIKEFKDIFLYIEKKFLLSKLGGNYGTFLKYIENPKKIRYDHTYRIATVFNVTPQQISNIIHNQIDSSKEKSLKRSKK